MLGHEVPNEYIEQVIAEADRDNDHKVTYEDFLNMWRQELEERKMNAWRGISQRRTVSELADEMLAQTSDDEATSGHDTDDFSTYQSVSSQLVSIAEIEREKNKSFGDFEF